MANDLEPLLGHIRAAIVGKRGVAWRATIPTRAAPQMCAWIAAIERRMGCTICADDIRSNADRTEIIISVRRQVRRIALVE